MKIGLDAGHGLRTAGKQTPDGIKEWTLNDKVRDKVVEILKDYDVEIIHTDNNEGNKDEALGMRRSTYVDDRVDAFVSMHHNAYNGKWNNATGVEVYVDKSYTSADMKLAKAIYKNLPNYTGLKGRGIKKENFTVINQNKVPAVLVEGGFMDGTIDNPVITSEKGQDAYARAVAEGLIEFLGLKKKDTTSTTKTNNTTNYTVKINSYDGELNVREKPDDSSKVKTVVKNGEVYTIVEEKNGWGKLKSDAGWISLKYTTKTNAATKTVTTISKYYPKCTSNYTSIVSALNSIKVNSSFSNRSKIAKKNGVKLYIGTASQNTKMLKLLKNGKLLKT